MTLKTLSALAIASIFILSTAAVEARPGDENRGGPDRGGGSDHGDYSREHSGENRGQGGGRRDDDRGGGRGDDHGHGGPGRGDDHGGPDHGGGPSHGGGHGGPGHGGGYPGPRPPHGGPDHGGPGYPGPRPPSYPPSYPPNYGQVAVQLPINQRMYNGTSINLTRFIDMNYYRGMRVVAVEVNARSAYNNAILDLYVNGYANTSIYVSPYGQIYSLFPGSVIIGYGYDLVLANRGDVDVYGVTVRLSR